MVFDCKYIVYFSNYNKKTIFFIFVVFMLYPNYQTIQLFWEEGDKKLGSN